MNAEREVLFGSGRLSVSLLGENDLAELQNLMERCTDYSELLTGLPTEENAARELLASHPETKPLADKYAFGLYAEGEMLIGVLDAVRDYPQEGTWYIGLMMIDPQERSQGWGEKAYHAFESWAAGQGAREIGLAVLEVNPKAQRFWQSMGFEGISKREPQRFGLREHIHVEMRKKLAG
jgi:GNAT superfamily N-acetyltransferase